MRRRLKYRSDGASSVEYGLLIALIAAAIVVSVGLFGTGVMNLFGDTCQSFNDNGGIVCN
jgi:Flp pilus assembly pilin Flp